MKLPPLAERSIDDKRLLESVVQHYHETLKQTPEAQQYLVKRGLQSAEMVEQFRLGFANRTLGYGSAGRKTAAPARNIADGCSSMGILRQESGHEHFNGSVVIPIFNLRRRSGADVRAKNHARHGAARRNAGALVSTRAASRRVERSRRLSLRRKSSCARR